MKEHKAGFVSIVGKPNAGKSTLMNQLVGERLSIVTSKAQTTRHRIMGIISEEDYQIVYSDTPGIISPKYKLQQSMMSFVKGSLEDADIILFVTDIHEDFDEENVLTLLSKVETPILLLLNKIDSETDAAVVEQKLAEWKGRIQASEYLPISALTGLNVDKVKEKILEQLPLHPPYFPKDEMTDKPERFFVSEIVREKLFLFLHQEVPYSCEVICTSFKEEESIIRISVEIIVERQSQKSIVIGKKGEILKKVGIEARKDMEAFFMKQVFLAQHVKVEENWRSDVMQLRRFGYID